MFRLRLYAPVWAVPDKVRRIALSDRIGSCVHKAPELDNPDQAVHPVTISPNGQTGLRRQSERNVHNGKTGHSGPLGLLGRLVPSHPTQDKVNKRNKSDQTELLDKWL